MNVATIVPRIVHYKQPVDFFVRNHRQIITHLRGNDTAELWHHPLDCTCDKCKTSLSSDCKIVFITNIELYDCAVGLFCNLLYGLSQLGNCPARLIDSFVAFFMSQSIPTGPIPPGNPRENFFEQANPGHFFV